MAKLAVAVFLVALLAIAASVSARITTITTTLVEEPENPLGQEQAQRCQQEIQQHRQQLQSCQRYLSPQMGRFYLNMYPQQAQEQQQASQCCQVLKNVREECRCAAVEHAATQELREGGRFQGEEMKQVLQKARTLPRTCGMTRPQECDISAIITASK